MRKKKLSTMFAIALLAGMTFSCTDLEDNDHYKAPSWAKGNAYEVMQSEGNYSIFLRGIDLVDTAGIVNGKSIVTVAAPNDDAFRTFLTDKGYSSIDEMYRAQPKYTRNLINMHLMYFAFDWAKLVNFRPSEGDGVSESEKQVNAGVYYKHRTHSQDPIEDVQIVNSAVDVKDAKLYHYERYLPVFSNKLFETKNIDAAYNYNYFYPNTTWYGTVNSGDGFNIANAAVNSTDNVITDNGYLYPVDKVIEPLNTIYDELESDPEFSQFLSLYDQYATYEEAYDETNTSLGYVAYIKSHGSLPPIASEWPISTKSTSISKLIDKLEHDGYSLFAPTNTALNNFFQTFWRPEGGYTSLETLDPLIKEYFIKQTFSKTNFIVFPEEIKKGTVLTTYDTPVNFDPDQLSQERRKICCNGVLYGMDVMTAPAIFSSVVGPAFTEKKYGCFLYCLDNSSLIAPLAATNAEYVVLTPSNTQFENSDPAMKLTETTSGNVMQQYSTETGEYENMGSSAMLKLVNMHISDDVNELPTSGSKVINTYSSFNYWFVKDGKITTNALFNNYLEPNYSGDPFCSFSEKTNNGEAWSNGKAYTYDADAVFEAQSSDNSLLHNLAVCQDKNYEYYLFAQLLQKTKLVSGSTIKFDTDEKTSSQRVVVFCPTNDAIKANIANIPGCTKLKIAADGTLSGTLTTAQVAELKNWIVNYFIASEENVMSDYPFIGSSCKGTFITKGLTTKLNIIDNGSSLSVKLVDSDKTVGVSSKYNYFPFAYSDACLHFIDDILE